LSLTGHCLHVQIDHVVDVLLALVDLVDQQVELMFMHIFGERPAPHADGLEIKSDAQVRKEVKKHGDQEGITKNPLGSRPLKQRENDTDEKTLYRKEGDKIRTLHGIPYNSTGKTDWQNSPPFTKNPDLRVS
jgi:hypothetical protein